MKINNETDLKKAFNIRNNVFVLEQNVPASEEYDEYENESCHYLAMLDDTPLATARWRKTIYGVKLERFATLKEFRGQHAASAIIKLILIELINESYIYLNAQTHAETFYEQFGFKSEGDLFYECDMPHHKMVYYK